jgi:PAS domain S-box-containing protein
MTRGSAAQEAEENTALYKSLFDFLTSCLSTPGSAQQLVELSVKAATKNEADVFPVYLLFEKYLTSFEEGERYTRRALREDIRERFPRLGDLTIFPILFVPEAEQKNTLAIQFLETFLDAVTDRFGRTGDGYFEKRQKDLEILEGCVQDILLFRKLQFISFETFKFVSANYGEALVGKIFEKTYESFSAKYKELEMFPYMITLVPKEIVGREYLGIFSQSQIEQIFLEKLAESEQLNVALDQKIRENEATQKLLRKNEILLGSVISSALDAIVITNQDGFIIHWNKAATAIFGYTEEEVKGKTFMQTIVPKAYVEDHTIRRFMAGDNQDLLNRRLELTGVRKNGIEFPMELTVTSIRNDNEYYFTGFIRDISVRRQREQDLVKMKEKAEQAATAKSQFLSVMSHELRTPLNAVIGITHLLLQNSPREDQQEDLRTLQFSGESLLYIINDILDFTKLDSGKIELSAIDFNLRELVQSLYQSFSYKAKEKNIVFDVEYDERMPFIVKGDNYRLSQVLNNLISNAIKFTSEGFVKLKVEMTEDQGQSYLTKFSVLDTGIGIAAEKKEKIFERFTQADSNTTRLYGGTGLGLSIASKLVELMDSTIRIETKLGAGSMFHFTIRLQKGDLKEIAMPATKAVARTNERFKDKVILLAEDNHFNAGIARRFIIGWGGEVEVVADGQQALEFALRRKYDLILMDVQMPVLDGYSCTRAIREHLPDIPIIAVTASPRSEVIEQILASGMDDFVSKPFKPNELRSKILEWL